MACVFMFFLDKMGWLLGVVGKIHNNKLINTSHNIVRFLNQINGKIPRSGVIDTKTINPHDSFYQCYKHGPDFLFGK